MKANIKQEILKELYKRNVGLDPTARLTTIGYLSETFGYIRARVVLYQLLQDGLIGKIEYKQERSGKLRVIKGYGLTPKATSTDEYRRIASAEKERLSKLLQQD